MATRGAQNSASPGPPGWLPDGSAPFGRAAEYQRLVGALAGTQTAGAELGRGGIFLIEGEAGIGKSFLLNAGVDHARSLGFATVGATAPEGPPGQTFGALLDAVAGWGLAGLDLLPRSGSLDEFRFVDALIDLVYQLCDTGPLVVAMEDLQWAAPSWLLAINRLAREIPGLPVLLVATMRPIPRGAELQALVDGLVARGANRIALEPLPASAIAQLAEAHLGARPGPRLLAHLSRAGGNPFFATELLACLQREDSIKLAGGMAEVMGNDRQDEPVRPSLHATRLNATVLTRLSYLSGDAIETLQVAAILGPSFSVADLAVAVGKPTHTLQRLMSSCVRAGLLRNEVTQLTFCHSMVRDALYQEVNPALRAWLHLAAAHVLEEAGRPREEIATHVILGAVPGDLEAVEWLRTAARQASSRSPAVAAELLRRAIELAPDADPHHREALADRARYLLASGQLAEAANICEHLLAAGDWPGGAGHGGAIAVCLVEAAVAQGQIPYAVERIHAAMASTALTDLQRCEMGAWLSACLAGLWDLPGCVEAAAAAIDAGERLRDGAAAAVALATSSLALEAFWRGNFAASLRLARRALAKAETTPPALSAPPPDQFIVSLVSCLVGLDQTQEALAILHADSRQRLVRGRTWSNPVAHALEATAHFWEGNWDLANASLHQALDAAELADTPRGIPAAHSMRSLIALHRGDQTTAVRESAAAQARTSSSSPLWRPHWVLWSRALVLEAQGKSADALQAQAQAWEVCNDAGMIAEFPVVGPDLVRLALAEGSAGLAQEAALALRKLADVARGGPSASISGAALRCQGMIEGDPLVLADAVAAYRASPRRRELALACEDASVAFAAAGQPGQARPLADEAFGIYAALQARRDTARARRRLQALMMAGAPAIAADTGGGASLRGRSTAVRVAPDATGRPTPGQRVRPLAWEALSPSESAVAALVAIGLSNRQIAARLSISARTVQSHVSNALIKLSLSSRVELAVQAAAGPTPTRD